MANEGGEASKSQQAKDEGQVNPPYSLKTIAKTEKLNKGNEKVKLLL